MAEEKINNNDKCKNCQELLKNCKCKKEINPEQQAKIDEYLKLQKELEENIQRVGKEINELLNKEGLMLVTGHVINIVPKR